MTKHNHYILFWKNGDKIPLNSTEEDMLKILMTDGDKLIKIQRFSSIAKVNKMLGIKPKKLVKTIVLKRLYGNIASIRDYVIDNAIRDNVTLKIELVGSEEYMLLTPSMMKKKSFRILERKFQSQFNKDQTYSLIDFSFIPTS